MKSFKTISILSCLAFSVWTLTTAEAQISLQENWPGTTIDSNNWTVSLPFSDSAYSVNNGFITLSNRVTILSTQSFYSPIVVTGTISLSTFDISRILTRTSGQIQDGNIYKELTGLWFTFNGVGAGSPGVSIIYASNAGNQGFAFAPFSFDPNTFYNFVITDNGTNASIAIDSNELASSAIDPLFSQGDQIAIYSRGTLLFAGPHHSTLGPIEISAVPEPSTFALLLLSGAASPWALKRRKS